MIEPINSPWACGVVMAKKKGYQLRFCSDFRYLNSVTVKNAYQFSVKKDAVWPMQRDRHARKLIPTENKARL